MNIWDIFFLLSALLSLIFHTIDSYFTRSGNKFLFISFPFIGMKCSVDKKKTEVINIFILAILIVSMIFQLFFRSK